MAKDDSLLKAIAEVKSQLKATRELQKIVGVSGSKEVKEKKDYLKSLQKIQSFDQKTKKEDIKKREGLVKQEWKLHKEKSKVFDSQVKQSKQEEKVQREFLRKAGYRPGASLPTQGQEDRALANQKNGKGKSKGMGVLGGLAFGALGVASAGASSLVGGGVNALFSGYQNYLQVQQAKLQSAGLASSKQLSRGAKDRFGADAGFNLEESYGHMNSMLRSTGSTDVGTFQHGMRASGMQESEIGELFSIFRNSTNLGEDENGGESSGKQLAKLLSTATASGITKALRPEFVKGTGAIMEQIGSRTGGSVDPGFIAGILGAMNKTGKAGMQGNRGAKVLGAVDNAIANPQGQWQESFMMRAMGFGLPGGDRSYLEAKEQMQEGLKGRSGTALKRIRERAAQEFGPSELEQAAGFSEATGGAITISQAKELFGAIDSGDKEKLEEAMEKFKPIEEQAKDAMKDLAGSIKTMQAHFDKGAAKGAENAKKIEDMDRKLLDISIQMVDLMSKHLPKLTYVLGLIADNLPNVITAIEDLNPLDLGGASSRKMKAETKKIIDQKLEGGFGVKGSSESYSNFMRNNLNAARNSAQNNNLSVSTRQEYANLAIQNEKSLNEISEVTEFFRKNKKIDPNSLDFSSKLKDALASSPDLVEQALQGGRIKSVSEGNGRTLIYLADESIDKLAEKQATKIEEKKNKNKAPGPKQSRGGDR